MSVPVRKATVYVCGLGYYKLYINGERVGDHELDPILRDYDKQAPYVTYDVTDLIHLTQNALGVILGNGRYYAPHLTIPAPTRERRARAGPRWSRSPPAAAP